MPMCKLYKQCDMKKILYLLLSAIGFSSAGCTPTVETREEVAMYAAPYVEFHPQPRVETETISSDVTDMNSIDKESQLK